MGILHCLFEESRCEWIHPLLGQKVNLELLVFVFEWHAFNMKKYFSEKSLRKQGLRFKPAKRFKKKIKITDVPKRLSGLSKLVYGDMGIMAMESSRFTFRQLDSIRRSLMKIR